mmetsp:Transcript_90608/g.233874  ORF Transcript_90608/g.233874 Transcript_90608/m.233874 type:complete len:463 (-) Transcript_90608:3-1391(-)
MRAVGHLRLRVRRRHAGLVGKLLRGDVRAVVVQEGPDVERLRQVDLLALQRRHDGRGLADVPGDHAVRDVVVAQVERRRHASLLVEVHADHRERVLLQHLAALGVVLDVLVDVHEQVAVARADVHNEARLRLEVLAVEDHVDIAHHVLEERLVLRTAADHVERAPDVLLRVVLVLVREAPARVLGQDLLEASQHRRVRRRHEVRVAALERQAAFLGHLDDPISAHRANGDLVEHRPDHVALGRVELGEVQLLRDLVLAEVQAGLVPARVVGDGRQQRRQHHAVQEDRQRLALGGLPRRTVLGPRLNAASRSFRRDLERRDGVGVDLLQGSRRRRRRTKMSLQFVQLQAGHRSVGALLRVEAQVAENAARSQHDVERPLVHTDLRGKVFGGRGLCLQGPQRPGDQLDQYVTCSPAVDKHEGIATEVNPFWDRILHGGAFDNHCRYHPSGRVAGRGWWAGLEDA